MADIFTMIGDALGINKGNATEAAAAKNRKLLKELGIDIEGLIDTGTETQAGFLQDTLDEVGLGPNGEGILRDVLGLGGDAGRERAMSAFRDFNPGYQFQVESGLDALDRRAASRGMLGSGNTNLDTLEFAGGLADQSFDDWMSNLFGSIDRGARARGDLATLYGVDTGQRIGLKEGIGNATMAANNQTAAGEEAGQGWLFDILDNVAGVAGSFMGMGGGGFPGFGQGGTGQGRTGAGTYPGGGGFYMGYGGGF